MSTNSATSRWQGRRNWQEFTVARGRTAIPSAKKDQQNLGLRADYDNDFIAPDGVKYHKYQIQPNSGDDIPASIKEWRNKNGGTHAVMGDLYVKAGGSKEDVSDSFAQFKEAFAKGAKTTPPKGSRENSPSQGTKSKPPHDTHALHNQTSTHSGKK
jgi:hypothetical protein